MQFADPQQTASAYLILRHLYDGDVIEWPIPDDHPLRAVFAQLETQGYVARWDRTWPRRDRYRLTETGIAAIEAVYRPAIAGSVWSDLRSRSLAPEQRRAHLQAQGYDPTLWAVLHDPSTQWDAFDDEPFRNSFLGYLWEDRYPKRTRRHPAIGTSEINGELDEERAPDLDPVAVDHVRGAAPYVVDLDREAGTSARGAALAGALDYDVS